MKKFVFTNKALVSSNLIAVSLRLKSITLVTAFFYLSILSAQTPPNTLSAEEEMAGYDLLFNGQDLDNWHAYRENAVSDAWRVRTDGDLGTRIQNGSGRIVYILSDKTYMNFDLKVDFQTPVDGNSGIFVRYEEDAISPHDTRSGPELQICGPADQDCVNPLNKVGACYAMFPVREEIRDTWYNPPGQWNQVRIVAYDSNYVHYGNGVKLLEYKIGTQEFLTAYSRSKYASDGNNGNYYDIHPGSILLQHHGEYGITFRNIKARELSAHPFTQEFPDGQWPDELDQEYVFGKRGCTDSTADNYDPDAEVDDGTCVEVSVNRRVNAVLKAQLIGKGGQWKIRVPTTSHISAKLYAVNGAEVKLRRIQGKPEYSIASHVVPGLYLLSVVSGESSAKQLILIP